MPANFTLDHERRLVDSRAWDCVSSRDLLEHLAAIRALFEDGTLDSTWTQVADFSDVTTTDDFSADVVHDLARNNPWPRECRRIVIAPMTVIFGLSRMYQLLAGDPEQNVTIVRTRTEALDLLALDHAP